MLPEMFRHCPEFMRHKELLISPALLDQHKIPYVRAVQQPREFMINYPGAYHAGFNAGYNCAGACLKVGENGSFAGMFPTRRADPLLADMLPLSCMRALDRPAPHF